MWDDIVEHRQSERSATQSSRESDKENRASRRRVLFVGGAGLAGLIGLPTSAAAQPDVSGGGRYDVLPGVPSEFSVTSAEVECKVDKPAFLEMGTELPSGFVVPFDLFFQMFMFSKVVGSVETDGNTATVAGDQMLSKTVLRPADDPDDRIVLEEIAPFEAEAVDNVSASENDGESGNDFFSLSVTYTETDKLDQADLFGKDAVFEGNLTAGTIVVG